MPVNAEYFRSCGLVLLALAAGCSGSVLRARNLPPEFRVASKPASSKINLAGIAAPGTGESRIDCGDLLEVTIASGRDDEKSSPVLTRVSEAGVADVPLVGPVQLAGLEPFEASQVVAGAAVERGVYRRPHVTLEIKSKCVNRITVMGAVADPGVHEIPRSSCDLVKALASAGGLSEDAGATVEIIRQTPSKLLVGANEPATPEGANNDVQLAGYQTPAKPAAAAQTIRVDLADAHPASGDYRLDDRDIVMVMPREKELVYVSGLVNKPGQFEVPREQELRLLDAIAMAGGLSSGVADKVLVIRRVPNRPEPIPIQASIAAAKRNGHENLVVGAGDVVSVEQTAATAAVDTFMKLIRFSVGLAGRTTVF